MTARTARTYPFTQLDVFSDTAGFGNPLAVVHAADGLSADAMQCFARWTNLSETTFLTSPSHPDADYALRIFTPAHELRFAGHPTLGSARAFLLAGGQPKDPAYIIQQCAVGNVRIRQDDDRLAFAAPPLTEAAVTDDTLGSVLAALGLKAAHVQAARWLDNGSRWLALLIDDHRALQALTPDHGLLTRLGMVGVIAPTDQDGCSFEVRAFAAAAGIAEDPVTGGLNAALAQWLIGARVAPPHYVVAQGGMLGRRGRVYVTHAEERQVWIGGAATAVITGAVQLA